MEDKVRKVTLVVREYHGDTTNPLNAPEDTFREIHIGEIKTNQSIEGISIDDGDSAFSLPLLFKNDVNNLLGKLLTLADATNPDPEHRKAVKDMMKQAVWDWHSNVSNLNHQFQID